MSVSAADVLYDFLVQCEQAYRRNPQDIDAITKAIDAIQNAKRVDLLRPWAERVYAVNADVWYAPYSMAYAEELAGNFTKAAEYWRAMHRLSADIDPLQLRLAQALTADGKLIEAQTLIDAAIARIEQGEDFQLLLWTSWTYRTFAKILKAYLLLRMGDPGGFSYHLQRQGYDCGYFSLPGVPPWNGEAIAGKHVFISQQLGYGDQILFASVIPQIQKLGAKVSLAADVHLGPLFSAALPGCRIIPTSRPLDAQQTPSPEITAACAENKPDLQTTLMQLPILRLTLAPQAGRLFPAYLQVPSEAKSSLESDLAWLKQRACGRPVVGIAWDRSQQYVPELVGGYDACRTARSSVPVEHIWRFIDEPALQSRVHFLALHEAEEHRVWPQPLPHNLSRILIRSGRFDYMAGLIAACDIVVSVDMVVANLSVFLGKRTLLMLNPEGEWRWGAAGPRSPWIAAAEMFRQPIIGDWASVLREILHVLEQTYSIR